MTGRTTLFPYQTDHPRMGSTLFTVAQLRSIEQQTAATLPAGALMQRAGDVAAAWIARRYPQARRVLVVCGPGNNGGDGYTCAGALRAMGRDVVCVSLGTPAPADAREASRRWQQAGGVTQAHMPERIDDWNVVVDAMFGIGLARPLSGPYLDAACAMRTVRSRVVALDVPSGLDADSGTWVSGIDGVHAESTVSFLGAKPGLFTGAGVDACGRLMVDTLGAALPSSTAHLIDPTDFRALAGLRPRNSHKGSFGNLLVVGGAAGMQGAPLLAARAGLRLGAGRVYVDVISGGVELDPLMPELMFRPASSVPAADAIVVGCGLGTAALARDRLISALQGRAACVVDADALNLLALEPALTAALRGVPGTRVLTPHPLEAARLLGRDVAAVQADRLGAARELARQFGQWIVLKGAGTVVAHQSDIWINPTGSAALATAGTGDVLAGFIGALLAQGYAPQSAILGAVWLHGRAADDFVQDVGLVASDLPVLAARALARLRHTASA